MSITVKYYPRLVHGHDDYDTIATTVHETAQEMFIRFSARGFNYSQKHILNLKGSDGTLYCALCPFDMAVADTKRLICCTSLEQLKEEVNDSLDLF